MQYVCRTRFDLVQYPTQMDIPIQAPAAIGSLVDIASTASAVAMKPVNAMW